MMDNTAFRAGFARGMRNISAGDTSAAWRAAVRRDHTADYAAGFDSALDHFAGFATHGVERAYQLGLCAAYAGFHGQSGYPHPVELPGHE